MALVLHMHWMSAACSEQGGALVVAEILEVAAHPSADRLRVCTLDVGAAVPISVVTNAADAAGRRRVFVAVSGMRQGTDVNIGTLSGALECTGDMDRWLLSLLTRCRWLCAAAGQYDSWHRHEGRGGQRQGRAEPRHAVLACGSRLGCQRQQGARRRARRAVTGRRLPCRAPHGALMRDSQPQERQQSACQLDSMHATVLF